MSTHDSLNNPRSIIKKDDGVYAYYFTSQVAYAIVRISHRFFPFISPNLFTIASTILGVWAAVAASYGSQRGWALFVVLLNVSFILDCCDGQLARLAGKGSIFGAWFDYHSDRIKDGLILLGVAWGIFAQTGDVHPSILVYAFLALYLQNLRSGSATYRDIVSLKQTGAAVEARKSLEHIGGSSQFMTSVRHSALFRVADRVMLYTVFAVLQIAAPLSGTMWYLHWMGLCIAVYLGLQCIFAAISGAMNYKKFSGRTA